MFPDADVVVVDEPDDPFGAVFARFARDVRVVRSRLIDLARAVTIVQDGADVRVEPSCALLLRPVRPLGKMSDPDDRFAWNEAFSTLWAAATMTDRPVINRPGEWGWSGRLSASAVVTQSRTDLVGAAAEAYWHAMPPDSGFRYHQSLEDWAIVEDPHGTSFGRSRAYPPIRGWERVVVVGSETYRVSTADLGPREIEADSVRVGRRLGLDFLTVSWAIPCGGEPAVLARVNAFPSVQECRPVLTEVCQGLLRRLAG